MKDLNTCNSDGTISFFQQGEWLVDHGEDYYRANEYMHVFYASDPKIKVTLTKCFIKIVLLDSELNEEGLCTEYTIHYNYNRLGFIGCVRNFFKEVAKGLDLEINIVPFLENLSFTKNEFPITFEDVHISRRKLNKQNILLEIATHLWRQFHTPVDYNDKIEEPFLHFEVGFYRFKIWLWFESEFDISVAKDLMGLSH